MRRRTSSAAIRLSQLWGGAFTAFILTRPLSPRHENTPPSLPQCSHIPWPKPVKPSRLTPVIFLAVQTPFPSHPLHPFNANDSTQAIKPIASTINSQFAVSIPPHFPYCSLNPPDHTSLTSSTVPQKPPRYSTASGPTAHHSASLFPPQIRPPPTWYPTISGARPIVCPRALSPHWLGR